MDYRVCWKCKGLSLYNKSTPNQMGNHVRQCPGESGSTIESSQFDYYVCDKEDFFVLLEIKQSLNKDVCIRLKNRDTTSKRDVPDVVIESLLKLTISKDVETPKSTTSLNLQSRASATRVLPRDKQASDSAEQIQMPHYPSQTDSCIVSNLSLSFPSNICEQEHIVNLLTDDEKAKLCRECNTVKKGNFEEFICKLCNYHSKSSKIMLRHLNTHNNGQAFHCKQCKFSTMMRSNWNLHQCKRNGGNSVCPWCSERFQSQRKLDLHLATNHSEKMWKTAGGTNTGSKQLHCNSCDYFGRDLASLKEHQRKHTGESLSCPLEECGFKTLYKRSLQKHLQQKHSKEMTQICEVCGFQTRYVASLKKHMLLHQDFKQYKCAECSYYSHSPSVVLLHVQRKHLKQKNCSCPKCPFQTGYPLAMKKHMARHERIEAEEAKGKKSVKTKNLKFYSCPICGDVFKSMNKAKEHLKKFHNTLEFQTISDVPFSTLHDKKAKEPHVFSDKNMNFNTLLDDDVTSDVLEMASNILNSDVSQKDDYTPNNVEMALPDEPMCQNMFNDSDSKSSVSRKGGNPMLSATSDALADIDSSLLEDSLFDLMSDLPRPPTLNRCQSASTLMFASFNQHLVDRPLTPDFFTDSPAQSFFQNFSSRSMDQDSFPVSSLTQPFQISSGFPSQMDLSASSSRTSKPLSPVLPNFTCFPAHHSASQNSLNLPSSVDADTDTAMPECLL